MMMRNKTLITVSVLLALAACSSDDFTGESEDVVNGNFQKIEIESLVYEDEHNTRSAYDATTNQLYWQQGDRICVYEKNLYDCDIYAFQSSQKAFMPMAEQTNITTSAAYALAPEEYVYMPGWTQKGVKAIFQMPFIYVYDSSCKDVTTVSGKTLYRGNLPMWGKASGEFGDISLSMKYLSAVMKLNLKDINGKATYIKVSSETMPMSGGLEIVVADKKGVVNENCKIQEGSASLSTKDFILVDLRNMAESDGTVYLPIVPDTYEDLTVSYTNGSLAYDDEGVLDESSLDNVEWKVIKVYAKGKEIKRGCGYNVTVQL